MPLYDIPICVSRETSDSGHSGHGSGHSGQTVDILDKLGIILDTILDKCGPDKNRTYITTV